MSNGLVVHVRKCFHFFYECNAEFIVELADMHVILTNINKKILLLGTSTIFPFGDFECFCLDVFC